MSKDFRGAKKTSVAEHSSPIFGPFLLWPNGWMHQDATWCRGRPQPMGLCVRWDPVPLPKKGAEPPPQFSAHFYCGQTAGWIKMALGTEVGLGPRHIVLDRDPVPIPKMGGKAAPPKFRPIFIVAKRMDAPRCHLVWVYIRPQPRRLCVRWGPSPPRKKIKGAEPQFSAHVYCGQTAAWIKMPLGTEVYSVGLRDIMLDGDPQFSAIVRCDQTAVWTKMPLSTEVGLDPDNFVFDGDPATSRRKGHTPPNFWPMSIVAKRLDG